MCCILSYKTTPTQTTPIQYLHLIVLYLCCNVMQVRFAPGLPPTHQSRYGSEEEESLYRPRSPKEAQLLRGSAVSPNYRRRQVNRLINMQQTSLEQRNSPSQSPNHSLDTQNSLIGSLDAAGRKDDTVMPSFLSIR